MPVLTNLRVIRRKIRSIENLRKITRAMQMVAAAKLKKTQTRLFQIRPYSDKISELLTNLSARVKGLKHELFIQREKIRKIEIIIITADKGLCGTYNANIMRFMTEKLDDFKTAVELFTIGRKATDYFSRRKFTIRRSFTGMPTELPYAKILEFSRKITSDFLTGEVDEVYLFYTQFKNVLTYRPNFIKLLPIQAQTATTRELEYIFEPEPELILQRLVPRYLSTLFQRLILESVSSEHAARMNAMRNATDNAEEMIENLTLLRNKVRQATITRELLDIVTGAEALKRL